MSKHSFTHADEARIFHEGIRLFNHGQWFEAHEVWEDIWHMAGGEKKRFYQGLIQLAVTIEHIRRGNPRGVLSVYASAVKKFTGLPDVYMGIDHTRLVAQIDKLVAPIRSLPKGMLEPQMGHGLALPVDLSSAPRIELPSDLEVPQE